MHWLLQSLRYRFCSRLIFMEERAGYKVTFLKDWAAKKQTDITGLSQKIFNNCGKLEGVFSKDTLSDTVVCFFSWVDANFSLEGAVIPPKNEDRVTDKNPYLIYKARKKNPGYCTDGYISVKISQSEELVKNAEEFYGVQFPDSYRSFINMVSCFMHSALDTHEGIIGPCKNISIGNYEDELELMQSWSRVTMEKVAPYIPVYADLWGNVFLFKRNDMGPLYFFDHETPSISKSPCTGFEDFFLNLLKGQLYDRG